MHWWIIIIVIGFNLLLLFANLRFVYYFMHKDDYKYNQGVLAQLIALIGLQIVWMLCSLLPTDVYDKTYDGGLQMLYFWQLVYLATLVYLSCFLPFAVFYYEADSDLRLTKSPPWKKAVIRSAITAVATWALIALLYLICHRVTVPVDRLQCIDVDCTKFRTITTLETKSVAFLSFLVALPGFFGWILLIFQGGVGLASLPLSLIQKFVTRPQPITLAQYERLRKILGERAQALRQVGETILKKEQTLQDAKGFRKAGQHMKLRGRVAKFKQVVVLLENEYEMLETAYKKRGMNPLYAYGTLLMGVLSLCLTILWVLQVLVVVIIPELTKKEPLFHLMGDVLILFGRSRVLAPELVFYMIVCIYVVLASLHGNIRISLRIQSCLPMQPLMKGETHLNALLFHIALCLLSTTAVVQLSTEAFRHYARSSTAESLFTLQKHHMRLISTFYMKNAFKWLLVIICLFSFVWLIIFPQERPAYNINDPKTIAKWEKLQKELGMEDRGTQAMQEVALEMGMDGSQTTKGPSMGERARAKLGRIDQKIENAPAAIFNAGFKQAAAS